MRGLSGVLVTVLGSRPAKKRSVGCFAVFGIRVQPKDAWSLGGSGYRPGQSPDKEAFCRVFCAFRYPFNRQMRGLSGVPVTVLDVRPAKKRSVGCFALFGIRSVDRSAVSKDAHNANKQGLPQK